MQPEAERDALLENACAHSPDGGPIAVRVEAAAGQVRLSVDGPGPGIPPDQRERVFDRFADRPAGLGLGLSIADAVVRWELGESPFGGASMAVTWPRAG